METDDSFPCSQEPTASELLQIFTLHFTYIVGGDWTGDSKIVKIKLCLCLTIGGVEV
jgi:hypothetical protein